MIVSSMQRQVVVFFECASDDVAKTINQLSAGNEIVSVSHFHIDAVRVSVLMVVRGRVDVMNKYEKRTAEIIGAGGSVSG